MNISLKPESKSPRIEYFSFYNCIYLEYVDLTQSKNFSSTHLLTLIELYRTGYYWYRQGLNLMFMMKRGFSYVFQENLKIICLFYIKFLYFAFLNLFIKSSLSKKMNKHPPISIISLCCKSAFSPVSKIFPLIIRFEPMHSM